MNRRLRAAVPFRFHAALSLVAASLLLGATATASAPDLCSDEAWFQNQFEFGQGGKTAVDFQEIHLPAPSGTWRIDAGDNGTVQVIDWDKNEVLICAGVSAWSPDQERAEKLLHAIHVETGDGRLRAEGPWQSNDARWGVSYRIYAPRAMNLDVQAMNGGIGIEGIRGRVSLRTENGPIAISDAAGDVEGRTTNGPVSVALTGSHWSGKGLDVETTNGPVHLSIPSNYSAELITGTENGPVAGAYVGTSAGHRSHHVSRVIGSGGAPIRVVTTNGPVMVREGE
jgi:putative adhesin